MKTRDEILRYAKEEDKPILLWLFIFYHVESSWQFVARCHFENYGTLSYQVHRIWEPTEEGRILYAHYLSTNH